MSRPRGGAAARRAALAVAATYTAFLLTAQFGFLDQVRAAAGGDAATMRSILSWMTIAGLAASTAAAVWSRRLSGGAAVRVGLFATALACLLSVPAIRPLALRLAAASIGGALGWLTVCLAAGLDELVPRGVRGRVIGWGTGMAYLVSNLPFLFAASPLRRAAASASCCLIAALAAPRAIVHHGDEPAAAQHRAAWPWQAIAAAVLALFALVAIDSAFFTTVQTRPALLALTWGSGTLSLRQGVVHLLAAVAAGAWIDAGGFAALPAAAGVLFTLAMPAIAEPGSPVAAWGAVAYAAGIAVYSVALVATAGGAGGDRRRRLTVAALVFAIAGWIGSAAGIGAAQDGALVGAARLAAAVFVAAGATLVWHRYGSRRWLAPGAAMLAVTALVWQLDESPARSLAAVTASSPDPDVGLGHEVYLAEGCQYCHSQYPRPATHDEEWWGPSRPFDRAQLPPTPGNRRVGPDLANVGLRRARIWNEIHLRDPRALVPGSRMPSYARLFDDRRGQALLDYLAALGDASWRQRQGDLEAIAARAPQPSGGSAARGAALFARHCAACHGREGRGNGAAATPFARPTMNLATGDFPLLGPAADRRRRMAQAIRFGIVPQLMPGHEWLSDREVADLVAFVETLGRDRRGAS